MPDHTQDVEVVDGEVVEARPVPGPPADAPAPRTREPFLPGAPVVVQAAAVAATGFVAGAATLAVVRHAGAKRRTRSAARRPTVRGGLPIVGSRTFLVDVHLVGRE